MGEEEVKAEGAEHSAGEIQEYREKKGGMRGRQSGFCSLGKMHANVCVCRQRGRS